MTQEHQVQALWDAIRELNVENSLIRSELAAMEGVIGTIVLSTVLSWLLFAGWVVAWVLTRIF